jgi:hypothetical protein
VLVSLQVPLAAVTQKKHVMLLVLVALCIGCKALAFTNAATAVVAHLLERVFWCFSVVRERLPLRLDTQADGAGRGDAT